jgi:short-subunit dehydrogenase
MNEIKKYALVTGASSGIGLHLAEGLARLGYSIIAVSNQPVELEMLKTRIEHMVAVTVTTLNIDLANENSARQVFDFCEEQELEIEVLVNNAGMLVFGLALKVGYSRINTIMNLHMITPVLLCDLFGEKMMAKNKGYILNVSSISAVMPYPGISLYGPTKAFLRHFTRALRTETRPFGIKVTCLIPGATSTNLYSIQNYNIPLLEKLGVFKKPEKVAKAGLKALFNDRPLCIPGWLNKIIVYFMPFIPPSLIAQIYKRTSLLKE